MVVDIGVYEKVRLTADFFFDKLGITHPGVSHGKDQGELHYKG